MSELIKDTITVDLHNQIISNLPITDPDELEDVLINAADKLTDGKEPVMLEALMNNHSPSKALFPSDTSKDGFLCGNSLRRMKEIVEQDLQIRFELRECRRTFGQRYIDQNLELPSVSILMGHASTRTTEKYYGRQKNTMAMDKARRTWSSGPDETSS